MRLPSHIAAQLPASVLTKRQRKVLGPVEYTEGGHRYRITVTVRFDDECNNGHNTFSITGEIGEQRGKRWVDYSGGCIHEDIARHFPALAPLIKWHLVSTDGPMHYVANTVYHAEQGKLDYARSTAVWPNATDDELKQAKQDLTDALLARLPHLMAEFKSAVESLGFVY